MKDIKSIKITFEDISFEDIPPDNVTLVVKENGSAPLCANIFKYIFFYYILKTANKMNIKKFFLYICMTKKYYWKCQV